MEKEQVEIKTPEYVSLQFQLSGLGSRAVAFMIDQLILTVITIVLLLIVYRIMWGQFVYFDDHNDYSFMPIAITIILLFILQWGYYFVYEYFSGGRTIGKKSMGIRVIQENGHSLTLLSCFIRNLMRMIDSLPAYYLLGMIIIFFHPKHKRLGDIVAGTIVVHERGKKKQGKKASALEKEIERRGLSKDDLVLEDWAINALSNKEWNIVKTYSNRFMELPMAERKKLTAEIASILLPKIGIEIEGMNEYDLENKLFILYLRLKDEWEYEL
ncbi:MAG TPA: RDD family protein [Bacillus bacterium]|nr:RDD family protein [Bacillus sp. (in: firmicutes)]